MDDKDRIRADVSKTYGAAVKGGGGCCGGGAAIPKGVTAKFAGYSPEELAKLPPDAVVNSFGCGNPLAFTEVLPGQTVVDLGSGAGIDILLAAKKVGPTGRVIGVDMTEEMIARARANIAAAGLANVEVRKGVIEELPVESGTVDWVISNCVINLSPEKERVFREIARVLKPGGRMVVSDIMVQDLPEWARQSAALYASCIGGAISEAAYLAGLRAAGLEEVEVHERLVYDGPQLLALAGTGLERTSCCGPIDEKVAAGAAEALAGKIWSAKVHARRPAG